MAKLHSVTCAMSNELVAGHILLGALRHISMLVEGFFGPFVARIHFAKLYKNIH